MKRSEIFVESFLDGFTMAGLRTRLRRPGAPTQVFADPDDCSTPLPIVFEVLESGSFALTVKTEASLSEVPETALHAMMELIQQEEERRHDHRGAGEAVQGASR
jgi:hypothetical protein